MIIKKYYSNAAEVVYHNANYRALYYLLLEMESAGLSARFHFCAQALPAISVCNCIRTLLSELQSVNGIYDSVEHYHEALAPVPGFQNPAVETIAASAYDFHLGSDEEREAILTLAFVISDYSLCLDQNKNLHFLRFLCEHPQDYRHLDLLESAYYDRYNRVARAASPDNRILEYYLVATSCLHSIELTLQQKNSAQRQAILQNNIESFLLEETPVANLISSMLILRLRALDAEHDALLTENEPGTLQRIASDEDASSKGATYSQQVLIFYYLFNALGINFSNSDKSAWARFIHFVTGASEKNLRKYMTPDFDKKSVQKDLSLVGAALGELFPAIAKKVEKDKEMEI